MSLLYMIAWMIVNIEVYSTKNKYFWHFTHWNVVLVSLYFFFSFAVTLHGLITQKNGKVQGQFMFTLFFRNLILNSLKYYQLIKLFHISRARVSMVSQNNFASTVCCFQQLNDSNRSLLDSPCTI